jgi:hypothetical protein
MRSANKEARRVSEAVRRESVCEKLAFVSKSRRAPKSMRCRFCRLFTNLRQSSDCRRVNATVAFAAERLLTVAGPFKARIRGS